MIKLTTLASRGTLVIILLIALIIGIIGNLFSPGFMDGPFKWFVLLLLGIWIVIFVYATFINPEFGVKDYHSYAIKARFWELLLGKEKAKGFARDIMKSGFGKFLGVVLMIMGIALIIISLYNLFY